jgi:hypothetical protein
VQIDFSNGGVGNRFTFNHTVGQHNLVVDLGKVDFEKDPDPKKISLGTAGVQCSWATAIEGHAYLERVRDDFAGDNFYVVFQVVAVDPHGRYMAFLWRRLPGGKVVKDRRGVD